MGVVRAGRTNDQPSRAHCQPVMTVRWWWSPSEPPRDAPGEPGLPWVIPGRSPDRLGALRGGCRLALGGTTWCCRLDPQEAPEIEQIICCLRGAPGCLRIAPVAPGHTCSRRAVLGRPRLSWGRSCLGRRHYGCIVGVISYWL